MGGQASLRRRLPALTRQHHTDPDHERKGANMSNLDSTTEKFIKNLVCDILDINPSDVTDTSRFEHNGAGSLFAIEIVTRLGKMLGITLDQQDVPRMVDLQGIYHVVAEARGKDCAAAAE
jgi:acyl carrier protein